MHDNEKFSYKNSRYTYYVIRSKNEVLCAEVGSLTAERSEADTPAKAQFHMNQMT
jgi:hypothetical protein